MAPQYKWKTKQDAQQVDQLVSNKPPLHQSLHPLSTLKNNFMY